MTLAQTNTYNGFTIIVYYRYDDGTEGSETLSIPQKDGRSDTRTVMNYARTSVAYDWN